MLRPPCSMTNAAIATARDIFNAPLRRKAMLLWPELAIPRPQPGAGRLDRDQVAGRLYGRIVLPGGAFAPTTDLENRRRQIRRRGPGP